MKITKNSLAHQDKGCNIELAGTEGTFGADTSLLVCWRPHPVISKWGMWD